MTLTGKILVMLIMVMSVVFMTFALMTYATHTNWRDLVENQTAQPGKPLGLRKQLEQLNDEITRLEDINLELKTQADNERRDYQQRIARMEDTITTLTGDVTRLTGQRDDLDGQLRESVAAMQVHQKELAERRDELAKVRAEILDVHRAKDDHFVQVVKLTDNINMLKGELERLKVRNVQLGEQIVAQQRILAYHNISDHTPENRDQPPRVEGKILALDPGPEKLVEISIGSDDGILNGHQLEVFRLSGASPRYLGRIQVVRTDPDRAVAKVIPGSMKAAFERDDHVATRLR